MVALLSVVGRSVAGKHIPPLPTPPLYVVIRQQPGGFFRWEFLAKLTKKVKLYVCCKYLVETTRRFGSVSHYSSRQANDAGCFVSSDQMFVA